jgi:hypothetical protein
MKINQILNLIYHYDEFYKETGLKFNNFKQFGGSIKLEYNNEIFEFEYNDHLYFYRTLDGENDCITIGIDKDNNTISINNITADDNFVCFKNIKEKKGTHLLLLAIKFAKKIKQKKYPNIKRIILTDNSKLHCSDQKNRSVVFSDLRQIISGDTFYGKHGFIPIDNDDKYNYNKNKKILSKMLLKDFDFEKYITKFIEINKNIKKSSMNNIIDFINENKEIKVGEFIDILSKKFNNNCNFIDFIMNKIYKHNNLKSMVNVKYEMKI